MQSRLMSVLARANGELWLILSMFIVLGLLNFMVASDHVLLGLYILPVVVSAYVFGRRHATLTALAAILMVVVVSYFNPHLFEAAGRIHVRGERWFEITVWGGTLLVTAYAMGTLYERMKSSIQELRDTYHGVLLILRHFISKDKYTENHSYRVAVYATKIAATMGLDTERVEDVRAAALLHDIGKLDISRELLYKAARLTKEEYEQVKQHVEKSAAFLEPVGGSLRRVLPIILAHHDKFDGSGYHAAQGDSIPIEARIISVADVYDSLVSDRPYRRGMSPYEVKEIIARGSGKDFDPAVVDAFLEAFQRRELELSEVVV